MTTRACNQEMNSRHLKLLNELANYFDPKVDQHEYDQFMNSFRAFLSPLAMKKSHNLLEAFKNLEKKGTLAVGKYDELRSIVRNFNVALVPIIDDAEQDIVKLQTEADARPPSSRTDVTSGIHVQPHSTVNTDTPTAPKRKREQDYIYNDGNKKGLLVIINITQNRAGTEYDEAGLKKFFEDDLQWEVETRKDLTYDRLDKYLDGLKERLTDRDTANKYYCLVVTVMSHGNKEGIYTYDSSKEVKEKQVYEFDRIFKCFKNDEIKAFTGKPKVFLIQSCRGSSIQGEVTSDDNNTMEIPEIPDSIAQPAVRITVPVDADMLIMWATTPGYKAFRGVFEGSHFLQEVVKQFKQNYEMDHLEMMLMKVRHTFANTEEYRKNLGPSKSADGKMMNIVSTQMPCSWSTLTKMLYLK
ncbi:caspase-3-like [Ylistrum balloti]|uniref:caspase-3-like n=1 Tax=Ylistrum balloti TaxID=509963 RepID=UPI002905CB02|nr:caspase-3-like [Ylistrum balloti]